MDLLPPASLDKIYVINLINRTDRRREVLAELARFGLGEDDPLIQFFPAVRPDDAGQFPSIGARGCFMSHLGILEDALASGHRAILLLEDDAQLTELFATNWREILGEVERAGWSLAYLGHRILEPITGLPSAATHWRILPWDVSVQTTHAMLIDSRALEPMIAYFRAMLDRPAGDAAGGPMHVDGAYSWFRRAHPHLTTLISSTQLIEQRASKSDIAPPKRIDRIPFMPLLRRIKNRVR